MRSRRFRPWRRFVAYLRAKRALWVTVEYEYVCVPPRIEIDPRPRRPDLTDLDEAERADWARFMEMMESGTSELLREPHLSRFVSVRQKVKWVLIDEPGGGHEDESPVRGK